MSVQAAVSSAKDFFQASVQTKPDNSDQGDAGSERASNSDFKNVLMTMRGVKRPDHGASASSMKNLTNGVVVINDCPDDGACLFPGMAAPGEICPDTGADAVESSASRFNPDVILGGLLEEVSDVAAESEAAQVKTADDPAEDEPQENEKIPPVTLETADTPDAGLVVADAPVPSPSDEKTISDSGESNDNAAKQNAIQNAASQPPPQKSGKTSPAEQTKADDQRTVSFGEAMKAEGEKPASETETKHVQRDDAEHPETSTEETEAPEGGEHAPGAKDAGHRARSSGDSAHDSRKENEEEHHAPNTAASERGDEIRPPHANVFGQFAETGVARTPASQPVFQMPTTYALESRDKFGEGLLTVVELMRGDESSEVRIVVEPPALGRVDVSLKSSSGGVEAMFRVDNEELKQMVQNQLDSLRTSLQAQGIHVSGLAVDIRNNDGKDGRNDPQGSKGRKGKNARGGDDGDIAEENRIVRLDLERGLLHWVA